MVTLGLIALCGVFGFAVDFGWAFYVRKRAQSYADSGALAAVEQALRAAGQSNIFKTCPANVQCGGSTGNYVTLSCPSTVSVDSTTNADNGCLYLRGVTKSASSWTGFVNGTNGGRTQTAVLDFSPLNNGTDGYIKPPHIPIKSVYWVRSRITERVPQLFSAIHGTPFATVAARGTAAIVGLDLIASIWLTNRQNDTSPVGQGGGDTTGVDMYVQGSASVTVPNSIQLASNINRTGEIGSGGNSNAVSAGATYVRNPGTADWTYSQKLDGRLFADPFAGRGQPPAPSTALPDCGVIGDTIIGGASSNAPLLLAPGNYYGVTCNGQGKNCSADWNNVKISGYVRFTTHASATKLSSTTNASNFVTNNSAPCMVGVQGTGTGFGNYIFWGGLGDQGTGARSATFEPGEYILAGMGGHSKNTLDIGQGMQLLDLNSAAGLPGDAQSNAGEIFVLTGPQYNNNALNSQFPNVSMFTAAQAQQNLGFGPANIQGGSNESQLQLHGLTPGNNIVDGTSGLAPFESVLFWQDQQNSRVAYTKTTTSKAPAGSVDLYTAGCATQTGGAVSVDNPCKSATPTTNNAAWNYQGGGQSIVYGVFYQPRGAWMTVWGNGANSSNTHAMIVSGALKVAGSAAVSFGTLTVPPVQRIVVLVE